MIPRAERRPEVEQKLSRLRAAMAHHQIDVVVFTQYPNVAWLTAGASTFVNGATEQSPTGLVITPDHAYAVTDSIEAPRIEQEEELPALGFAMMVEPWYDKGHVISRLTANHTVWYDTDTPTPFNQVMLTLRATLSESEIDRLREFSQEAGAALEDVARAVRPGMAECDIAGMIERACRERGGASTVTLVGTDDRIYAYRHPLPTQKILERYAMLVMCYRRDGLVISATRCVHFGALPAELARKSAATAEVDARVIAGTQPGKSLSDMFALLKDAYQELGFPEAIEEHHQGGLAGYRSREMLATPSATFTIAPQQAFAWNPSIRGCKSEDTILLTSSGPEILTATGGSGASNNWPTIEVVVKGQTYSRPAILIN